MNQWRPVFEFGGRGPEAVNGRIAMAAFLITAVTEVATGKGLLEQAASPAGSVGAIALMVLTTAASVAPTVAGG